MISRKRVICIIIAVIIIVARIITLANRFSSKAADEGISYANAFYDTTPAAQESE